MDIEPVGSNEQYYKEFVWGSEIYNEALKIWERNHNNRNCEVYEGDGGWSVAMQYIGEYIEDRSDCPDIAWVIK